MTDNLINKVLSRLERNLKVMADSKQVAAEILKQLGGPNRLRAMLGTRYFSSIDKNAGVDKLDGLAFDFKGNRKLSGVRILYVPGKDLYNMIFIDKQFKPVITKKDIYNDQLKDVFESVTGLRMSL